MINEKFWEKVASRWRTTDDGISVPEVDAFGVKDIDPDDLSIDVASDEEIEDILSDLGLDD